MTINKTTIGGRSGHRRDITPGQARLVTARFVLRQLLFFFLAQVPHSILFTSKLSKVTAGYLIRNGYGVS